MAKTRTIDSNALLHTLMERVESVLQLEDIHPRDLGAVGNLVLKIVEREDKIKAEATAASGAKNNVVAMPAMPAIRVAKELDNALERSEAKLAKAKRA